MGKEKSKSEQIFDLFVELATDEKNPWSLSDPKTLANDLRDCFLDCFFCSRPVNPFDGSNWLIMAGRERVEQIHFAHGECYAHRQVPDRRGDMYVKRYMTEVPALMSLILTVLYDHLGSDHPLFDAFHKLSRVLDASYGARKELLERTKIPGKGDE